MANKIILKKSSVAAKVPLSTDLEVGEIAVNLVDQKLYSKKADGTVVLVGNSTLGDVTGAASSTDNAVTRFDGTTGKVIQNSSVIIDDSNNVSGVATLNAANIVIADNATLGSSNTDTVAVNGRITTDLDPNTTGTHDIGTSGRNWRDGFFSRNLAAATLNATDVNANSAIISANSSTNALRITQVGTGNALLVEDSANPDATPFVVNADGVAVSGYTSAVTAAGLVNRFQSHANSTSAPTTGFGAYNWVDGDAAPAYNFFKARGGVVGTPSAVTSTSQIGRLIYYAYDGSNWLQAANINVEVDGTPGTNDMPGRLIFSTTADGASSPTERMRIDNAGNVFITNVLWVGGGFGTATKVGIAGTLPTGSSNSFAYNLQATVPSASTNSGVGFQSILSTAAASFTVNSIKNFNAQQGTIGATSAVTNQYGYFVDSSLTGANNNYGFYSNIASGTGRWNFYAAGSANNFFQGSVGVATTTPYRKVTIRGTGEQFMLDINSTTSGDFSSIVWNGSTAELGFGVTSSEIRGIRESAGAFGALAFHTRGVAETSLERMRITSNGSVGIGGTPGGDTALGIYGGARGTGTANIGFRSFITVPSTNTGIFNSLESNTVTQAASFTLGAYRHYLAAQTSIGAGSTITNQIGFLADAGLTGATNNFGFRSNIASGTGRWNFYADGSAANYFAGNVGIGTTSPNRPLTVSGIIASLVTGTTADTAQGFEIRNANAGADTRVLAFSAYDNGTAIFRNASSTANGFSFQIQTTERLALKPNGQLRFIPMASDPAGAQAGDVYYNSSTNKLKVYNGSSWIDLH